MSTLAPAPIQFVTSQRAKDSGLILPARSYTVAEVVALRAARVGGVALFAVGAGNVAIRVGREEDGIVGYASADHALAFAGEVITALADADRAAAREEAAARAEREEAARAFENSRPAAPPPRPGEGWSKFRSTDPDPLANGENW